MTDMQRLARFVAAFDAHGLAGIADLPYNDVVGVFADLRQSIRTNTDTSPSHHPLDTHEPLDTEGTTK